MQVFFINIIYTRIYNYYKPQIFSNPMSNKEKLLLIYSVKQQQKLFAKNECCYLVSTSYVIKLLVVICYQYIVNIIKLIQSYTFEEAPFLRSHKELSHPSFLSHKIMTILGSSYLFYLLLSFFYRHFILNAIK